MVPYTGLVTRLPQVSSCLHSSVTPTITMLYSLKSTLVPPTTNTNKKFVFPAQTRYKVIRSGSGAALVELNPVTGKACSMSLVTALESSVPSSLLIGRLATSSTCAPSWGVEHPNPWRSQVLSLEPPRPSGMATAATTCDHLLSVPLLV